MNIVEISCCTIYISLNGFHDNGYVCTGNSHWILMLACKLVQSQTMSCFCTGFIFLAHHHWIWKIIGKNVVDVAGVTRDFQLHVLCLATGVKAFAYIRIWCLFLHFHLANKFIYVKEPKCFTINIHWLVHSFNYHVQELLGDFNETQHELISINDSVDRKCKFCVINFGFTDKWLPHNY